MPRTESRIGAEAPRREAPAPVRPYLFSGLFCAALVALPFLLVRFPPVTDLPQLVAQVRLLFETLGDPASPYRIQWLDPNTLGYLPLVAGWLLAGPADAGRLGMALLGVLWTGALHGLARATGRPPAAAALATLFFWNHLTYWGFLNFLIGLPAFALFFVLVERLPAAPRRRDGAKLLLAAALLYACHVLWLLAGLGWLVVATLRDRRLRRGLLPRLLWTAPVLAAAAVWYPSLAASGFDSAVTWGRSPLGRLHPEWLLNAAFGGLAGPVEWVVALAALGWLLTGLVQDRGRTVDRTLATAGGVFVAAALCLPGVVQHTQFFASRWLPVGLVLLALATPPPRLRPALRAALPLALVASLGVATAAAWLEFEERELAGLDRVLDAVPAGPHRVLGLDFVRAGERIKGFPFYHLYVYAQVLRGSEPYKSFADLGSSLVVYRELPRPVPWTEGLDWDARRVRRSDMAHFDYLILFGPPAVHELFAADPRLVAQTADAPWRLYRVDG